MIIKLISRFPSSSASLLCRRIRRSYAYRGQFFAFLYPAACASASFLNGLAAYKTVLPAKSHQVCAKSSGHTNIIERFNCTLRQRVSRLVRLSMSFSKTVKNHIGAIKYFICSYNKEVIGFAEPALHL
jgi:insertion element IS1 protein InsB